VVGLPAYTPSCLFFVEFSSQNYPTGFLLHLPWSGQNPPGTPALEKSPGNLRGHREEFDAPRAASKDAILNLDGRYYTK
jgi:hypothetical protein